MVSALHNSTTINCSYSSRRWIITQAGIIRCQALQVNDQLWFERESHSLSLSYNSAQLTCVGTTFCGYSFTSKLTICSKSGKHSHAQERLQQPCKYIFLAWNLCISVMPIYKTGIIKHFFFLLFLLSSSPHSFSNLLLENLSLLQSLQHENFFWTHTWMY